MRARLLIPGAAVLRRHTADESGRPADNVHVLRVGANILARIEQAIHALDELAYVSAYEYSADLVRLAREQAEKVVQDGLQVAQSSGVPAICMIGCCSPASVTATRCVARDAVLAGTAVSVR